MTYSITGVGVQTVTTSTSSTVTSYRPDDDCPPSPVRTGDPNPKPISGAEVALHHDR